MSNLGGRGKSPPPPTFHSNGLIMKLALLIVVLSTSVYLLVTSLAKLRSTYANLELPTSVAELKALDSVIETLQAKEPAALVTFFCSLYVLKQTFAIPGSLILNILAGRIFGIALGFLTTTICTTIGATCCFLIAQIFGRGLVEKLFPDRLNKLHSLIQAHRDDLIFYLIFIRAVAFVPNWFVNISSPVLGIPLLYHMIAIFIGMIPYHYRSILSQLNSTADVFNAWTLLKLGVIGTIAIVPVIVRRWRQGRQH